MADKAQPTQRDLNIAMFASTVNLYEAVSHAALAISASGHASEQLRAHMESLHSAMAETKAQLKETLELLKQAES